MSAQSSEISKSQGMDLGIPIALKLHGCLSNSGGNGLTFQSYFIIRNPVSWLQDLVKFGGKTSFR